MKDPKDWHYANIIVEARNKYINNKALLTKYEKMRPERPLVEL